MTCAGINGSGKSPVEALDRLFQSLFAEELMFSLKSQIKALLSEKVAKTKFGREVRQRETYFDAELPAFDRGENDVT